MFNLSGIDPIILDVALTAMLVLFLFFGVIRGVKSVLINMVIGVLSLFLGFTKYMNSLKYLLVNRLINIQKLLPAGSTNATKFGAAMASNIAGSIMLTILFFMVLNIVYTLISMIIKRRFSNGEKGVKGKGSRIFGGIINFIYGFALALVAVFMIDSNIIGGATLVQKTTVTSKVLDFVQKPIQKSNKDAIVAMKLKLYTGDVLYDVDFEMMDSYEYIEKRSAEIFLDQKYLDKINPENSDLQMANKDALYDLFNLAILSNRFNVDNPDVNSKFCDLYNEWIVALNKSCVTSKIEISFEMDAKMEVAFRETGLKEKNIQLYKNIVIVK